MVWGKNDVIFTVEGARLYTKDLKNAEFQLFDTGHFALEEDLEEMTSLMRDLLAEPFLPSKPNRLPWRVGSPGKLFLNQLRQANHFI